MKTLIYDPQPRRRFPLGREAVRDRGEQSIIFPDNGKPLRNFVKESFCPRDSAWFEDAERARSAVRASLVKNGYDVEERPTSDGEMRMGAGGFPVAEWELGNEAELVQGYIINGEFGNIEGAHVHLLVSELREAGQRDVSRVLDLGCGPTASQKINLENAGSVKSILYVDNDESKRPGKAPVVERLETALSTIGNPNIQREFRTGDKDRITDVVDKNSIGLVLRLGVGHTCDAEVQGLSEILASDGAVFISNSIAGQPPAEFLAVCERNFGNIEVHLGYQRYAAICRK